MGHQWTLYSTLEDLDFTADLNVALVSHTHQQQWKTTNLSMFAQQVGLKISQKKTEVMLKPLASQSEQRRSSNN